MGLEDGKAWPNVGEKERLHMVDLVVMVFDQLHCERSVQ